ncbi:MAG: T9SS type A sorting domain-containing protein [Saprospiraceae bacterium]
MKKHYLFIVTLLLSQVLTAQSFLRVADPNWWGLDTDMPGWENYSPEGAFEDIGIVLTPLGVYTEVEVYATIADLWGESWGDNLEIIWQFELPGDAIVHDSWLWVEDEIIRADIVDYWTALNTYEEIVDRNQDPSFLFIKPDNRYELRVFPLPVFSSRRVKMNFLVPSSWERQTVFQSLLQPIFNSTTLFNNDIQIQVAVDSMWGTPVLHLGEEATPMNQLTTAADGQAYHIIHVAPTDFIDAATVQVSWDAPLNGLSNAFVSTWEQNNEQFYQVAFVPDWNNQEAARKELILVNYEDAKTSETLVSFTQKLSNGLLSYYGENDSINIAVPTLQGVALLGENWLSVEEVLAGTVLYDFLSLQDNTDMETLLNGSLQWASQHGGLTHLYLLAAVGGYVFPPLADEAISTIAPNLPTTIPFSLLDFQDQEVSIVYYQNEVHEGNSYFYENLASYFETAEYLTSWGNGMNVAQMFSQLLDSQEVSGISDFSVTLENGICFQRYNIGTTGSGGVLTQVGKYVGQPPFEIRGVMLTDDNQFIEEETIVPETAIATGDSLMQEMWYGMYLDDLYSEIQSNEDRHEVIDISMRERVLTPLTAFIALEPSQGGVPCDECLDGTEILIATNEPEVADEHIVAVTPNPASTVARIALTIPADGVKTGWKAVILDTSGKIVAQLDLVSDKEGELVWEWKIPPHQPAGLYVCKLTNSEASLVAKIVVAK